MEARSHYPIHRMVRRSVGRLEGPQVVPRVAPPRSYQAWAMRPWRQESDEGRPGMLSEAPELDIAVEAGEAVVSESAAPETQG